MSLSVEIEKKLKDFKLQVYFDTSKEKLGLLGASGCGKSMTLKCIAGIIRPDKGKIVLNDEVLFDSEKKINRIPQKRQVGYLFQNYALFPNMTVEENIGCGIKGGKLKKAELINHMLELLHITALKKRYPKNLSGGQQQRVALARILAYEPKVLMLDEPFSALDYYLKDQLQQELLESLEFFQGDIIMVTHSRDEVYRFCEKMVVMDSGKIVTKGTTKELFQEPEKLVVAKLTGCKNISKLTKVSEHTLIAEDWGVKLTTNSQIPAICTHVGIRAHDLRLGSSKMENSYQCEKVKLIESPFENNMVLKLSGAQTVLWKVSKAYYFDSLKGEFPTMVRFPEESLMFLH